MHRFHDTVIRPLLDTARPRRLLEVGAYDGAHTRRLLPWALANDAELVVVDPAPRGLFEADEFDALLHRSRSIDVLDELGPFDCALIDGDHNWYTVFSELVALEGCPLIFVHDVEWPYARRDAYFDPEAIPEAVRQPIGYGGVIEGCAELDPAGLNAGAAHAQHEGGLRNGVLTAVEDFLARDPGRYTLQIVSGQHGLAILSHFWSPAPA